MPECFFCDYRGTERKLAEHVANSHCDSGIGVGWAMMQTCLGPDWRFRCWCGSTWSFVSFARAFECMLKHWEDNGGVNAHILELVLGVYDG